MIRSTRSACKSTKAGTTITSNAAIPRWHSATCQHRAAPHSASSIHITRAQKHHRDDESGGIAASIELAQRMGGTPDWAEGQGLSSSVIGAVVSRGVGLRIRSLRRRTALLFASDLPDGQITH